MQKKFIGLDYGEKTIGVAVSHNGRVATGVKTLFRKDPEALRPCLKELKTILREYEIKDIVLGFPKNMDGEDSARCAETLAFKEKLLRYFKNVNVILWDERLSTLAVLRVFDGKQKNYKKNVDKMAAVYILQGYLDYLNRKENDMLQSTDANDFENFDDDGLYIESEDGQKIPINIVASQEDENGVYLLAVTEDESEAVLFKCSPHELNPEEVILETIDRDHKDFKNIFAMFKDDCEELGLDLEVEGE
ncbi:MAG: Holliday junction resolvase RuvX [Defluviitaleaceae bacterium]|nr:Holliday junction resolvase RuvX [Defluviitaleaceae bacterium]MCL2261846.1 Holliday junction resolvase RuvX [Defluviitaleaceae bacterium]